VVCGSRVPRPAGQGLSGCFTKPATIIRLNPWNFDANWRKLSRITCCFTGSRFLIVVALRESVRRNPAVGVLLLEIIVLQSAKWLGTWKILKSEHTCTELADGLRRSDGKK
jgi:hypothetical protein